MTRIVRAQVAQEVGQSLRDLGLRIQKLEANYTGEALDRERDSIANTLGHQLSRLDQLVESCRQARNSYPNYPALRRAITEAGDVCYDIKMTLTGIRAAFGVDNDSSIAIELLRLGQQLKTLAFVAPSREKSVEGV
jgi:hypothetical protein